MDIGQIEDEDKAVEENVEEVEEGSDDSNVAHKLQTVEDDEMENLEKEAEISMASHKLSEVEPEFEFLSLPTSFASHLVLPVEWPETGLLSSMVVHQIFQPGVENLEKSIPHIPSPTCESISATSAKEPNKDTFEDNLRENIKDWFKGVNFKSTYGNFEENWPETTFVEDSEENVSMDYEVLMVDQTEPEDNLVKENMEEADKESDESNIVHKHPKVEKDLVKEAEISMAAHKLAEVEQESEFLSLPASLASHLVLPVEWPETGLLSSMVAHQIFLPCPENLEETILLIPSLDIEGTRDSNPHLSQPEANEIFLETEDLEENLRKDFKGRSNGVDFKATYCHFEEETTFAEGIRETFFFMDKEDPMEISLSKAEPKLDHSCSLDDDHTRENISEEVAEEFLTEETPKTHITEDASQESLMKPSMVGHQVVEAEEPDLPYASMAAHWSFVPEWKEEGTVSSGVSHQLLNQHDMEEDDILKQNVPEKWEENVQEDAVFEPFVSMSNQIPVAEREKDVSLTPGQLPDIQEVEEPLTEKGVREAEVSRIRKEAEIDPRRRNTEPASSSAPPKSPVGTSDDEKDSFENFIKESKQTYHERVADEYKSTIKRIQDLHKLVEEEIGEFEKSRKDVRKSEVITVMSNVRGVSFPLEITINKKGQKEDSSLETEGTQGCQKEEDKEEGFDEASEESDNEGGDDDSTNIISATCTLRENTPILITTNMDNVECDSGFEGSPDLQKTEGVRSLQVSLTNREAESPVSFPKKTFTTPKRSSVEEKKTRDKQLLESFLKNENHQIKDKTTVTSNSDGRVTPEKKHAPKIPDIPPPIAQEPKEGKKQKNRKPKVTTTAFKDSIMKKTYKIRFHVNLKETEGEKPRSVLQTFLSFFKDHSIFGKK